ncbi:hypothetical protein, partial [Rhodovulum sp. PH10]|uniref:hypothetical protein n=1 Tax=Rhodovulum sp. PH10 TaxID=1187851 RepID=UPI000590A7EA
MDLVVSPIAISPNAQGGGNAPAFTPGQVVDALVLRLIDQTHVQLAIGNSLIDVQTAVLLEAGTHVQLAVRATPDGMKLVLLHAPVGGGAASPGSGASGGAGVPVSGASPGGTATTAAGTASAATTAAAAAAADPSAPA